MPPRQHKHSNSNSIPDAYSEEPPPIAISPERKLLMTTGMFYAILTSIIGGLVCAGTVVYHLDARLTGMEQKLAAVHKTTKRAWTVDDEREMAHRMTRENKELKIPNPADVHQEIHKHDCQ